MTVTYNPDPLNPYSSRSDVKPLTGEGMDLNARRETAEEPFIPVYARRGKTARRASGKIPTWMILAPVGAIALGAIVAMLMMDSGGETTAPLAEPAATAPVVNATPLTPVTPLPAASTPAPVSAAPAPAPVVREAAPVRRAAAPARRTTPAAPGATTAPTARVATPAPDAPSTVTLNTAPTPPPPVVTVTPAPEPTPPAPAPIIVVEPLN